LGEPVERDLQNLPLASALLEVLGEAAPEGSVGQLTKRLSAGWAVFEVPFAWAAATVLGGADNAGLSLAFDSVAGAICTLSVRLEATRPRFRIKAVALVVRFYGSPRVEVGI
jgi:hypothetical protein